MSTRRKRATPKPPPPPPPAPPIDPTVPSWASRPVDWSDPMERGFWLGHVRIFVDQLVNAAVGACDIYASPGQKALLQTKITEARRVLHQLLHTAGAYPAVTPVAEPRYCGRCGCGPFEALACPSCGEDDDIPRRPQGSRRD